MKLSQISRMTRSSSPSYPTVRNAYIGSIAAGVVAFVYNLVVDQNLSLWDPIAVGIAAFLGWAIAREIDPDRPRTALVALAGSALLAVWSLPLLLVAVVALGALRLLVGTVGGPGPTTLDLAVMVGLAAYAGWHIEGWFLAVIITIGIIVSGGRRRIPWAMAAAAAAIGVAIISDTGVDSGNESFRLLALAPLLVVVVLLALPVNPSSVTDIGKIPIDRRRLRAARFLAGLAIVAVVIASDFDGLTNLGPVTATAVATAVSAVLSKKNQGAL